MKTYLKKNKIHTTVMWLLIFAGVYINHWFFTVPLLVTITIFIADFINEGWKKFKNRKRGEA